MTGTLYITGDERADALLNSDANALLIGMLLDQQGVAVRTGHHCTMPLMTRYDIPGTVRASLSIYNTVEEVDRFLEALEKVRTFL